jgi:hypothetical protein
LHFFFILIYFKDLTLFILFYFILFYLGAKPTSRFFHFGLRSSLCFFFGFAELLSALRQSLRSASAEPSLRFGRAFAPLRRSRRKSTIVEDALALPKAKAMEQRPKKTQILI